MKFDLQSFNVQINVSKIAYIHYFEFTNHYHTQNDSHNFCELLYVDKGTLSVHARNFSGELCVNQLIIHRPDEIHSLTTSDTVAPNVIIIGFECENNELIPFSQTPVTLTPEQTKTLSKILQEGMSVFEPPYDIPNTIHMPKRKEYPFGADQLLKIGLESFLISLIREHEIPEPGSKIPVKKNPGIYAVYQYITENYNTKITLDNLCFLFAVNKTSLCRDFRQEFGITVLGYINSLKIREAKSLLRSGNYSHTEISEKLGFASIHYFSRMFKKHTGQSPSEYIKTVKSRLMLH
ncbi:MAG: helix-turn-helix transcriptional regulator [Clostridia bacterium]|nr:helix-turn-helix transcriptional regulator [Clostridia bacterium]